MTTPLLAVLYPRAAVEADAAAGRRPVRRAPAMSGTAVGPGRVMVGVTDPVTARPLLRLVSWMRRRDGQPPEVVLSTVVAPPGYEQVRANLAGLDESAGLAAEGLGRAQEELTDAGVAAEAVTAVGTDPGAELRRLGVQRGADLLLIGSHEAYLGFRPLGGVAGELLRDAPGDVAVLVGMDSHSREASGPIGVWFRGEAPDLAPLEVAAALARGTGESLRVVTPVAVDLPDLDVVVEVTLLPEPTVSAALAAVAGTSLMVVAPPGVVDGVLPALREAVIERSAAPVLVVRGGTVAADDGFEAGASVGAPAGDPQPAEA